MSFFSFSSKRTVSKSSPSSKRTFVPRLEALESRNLLSTYVVTNTASDANTSGSLPWAVQQANANGGVNYINFNIPGSGIHIIDVTSSLYMNDQMVIDGTTQPGYNGTPLISVQGSGNVPSLFYLGTGSSGSTIQGLDMYSYSANAVTLSNTTSGNWIQNDWMGFYRDPSSGKDWLNSAAFSDTSGLGVQSSYNTIRNNVISGGYNAIRMGEDPSVAWSGTVYKSNSIQYNFIGTDPSGTTAQNYGNQSDAIFLGAGAEQNFLGPYNVLSGNAVYGVEMLAPSVTGNVIFKDNIGTDVNGNVAIANGNGVLLANGAYGNAVGGPFGGNIISGNINLAISIGLSGYGVGHNNWVQGNIIGLNGSQTAVLGAGEFGISINSGSSGNYVQGNVIAGASTNGVIMASTQSNDVTQNWIGESSNGTGFANGEFGIALTAGANYNFILQNAMGLNRAGTIYVDPNAVGNDIQ